MSSRPPPPSGHYEDPTATYDNPNQHISSMGMITTLGISIGVFVVVQGVFETNRYFKQIYLKRLQKRFEDVGRVPPVPPSHVFGWLVAIYRVSEMDVLRMVGLDAYMCLRYHVVCYKLALFMSFWGIIALTPIYSTAEDTVTFESGSLQWDRYTLRNVVSGAESTKYRLWAAAVFGYIFAAYFMQLLYAEYNNFSVRRLQYLVQANPDSPQGDPDTPPQKYFTIMVENIPGHLRSAPALYKFFAKLFPGEVYNVEIALDLSELNALTAQRQSVRDALEKAIAAYEATNVRPQVYIQTGKVTMFPDGTQAVAAESNTLASWLQRYVAPEMYGFELLDAIAYYTHRLQTLNKKVDELQHVSFEYARNADKKLKRRLRDKADTRAAAVVETLKTSANIFTNNGGDAAGADGDGGSRRPRRTRSKRHLASADSDDDLHAAAAATAGASAAAGPDGAPTKALLPRKAPPFWETFLFGAQTEEFDVAAKVTLTKMHGKENGKSKSNGHKNGAAAEREGLLGHGHGPATRNPLLAAPVQVQEPPRRASLTQRLVADDAFTVKATAKGGFRLKAPAAGGYGEADEDDDDDDSDSDSGDDDEDSEGSGRRPRPGEMVRTMSNATRNFNVLAGSPAKMLTGSKGPPPAPAAVGLPPRPPQVAQGSKVAPAASVAASVLSSPPDAALAPATAASQRVPFSSPGDDGGSGDRPMLVREDSDPEVGSEEEGNGGGEVDLLAAHMAEDATLREWMKTAHVDVAQELAVAERRAEQLAAEARQARYGRQGQDTARLRDINDLLGDKDPDRGPGGGGGGGGVSKGAMRKPSVDFTGLVAGALASVRGSPPSGAVGGEEREGAPGGPVRFTLNADDEHPPSPDKPALAHARASAPDDVAFAVSGNGNGINTAHGDAGQGHGVDMAGDSAEAFFDGGGRKKKKGGRKDRNTGGGGGGELDQFFNFNELARAAASGLSPEQLEEANKLAKVGWEQTKIAGTGALQGLVELERTLEMLTLGAYYKYSSTAFVTFNSRVTQSVAQQMLLSHDAMEINGAPNPHDIIWDNVSIPRSQIKMRNFITNAGVIVGSLFWSSLVTSINDLVSNIAAATLPLYQQQYLSVCIILGFLLLLPFIFDFLARYYEGIKLESEIQTSIMTRYFWYQLINVYVTVGFGGVQIITQLLLILKNPQLLVNFVGQTIPAVSLYFVDVVIIKIFAAVPFEMIRPWQLSTIHLMSNCMDRRKTTRRDLRTGAFYAWPMLYGWIYPQLLMVTMIQVTYACIAPLLMPFCAVFWACAYLMYKYQLLYVYINDYQSGGDMWYATFGRSLISLIFASVTLLGYLSLELNETYLAGPFYFLFPLPFCIIYFWYYCEAKFKKPSMNLSFGFAKELDARNAERRAAGRPVPHDGFRKDLYRQPALTEQEVYPEPYRRDTSYDHLRQPPSEEDLEAAAGAGGGGEEHEEVPEVVAALRRAARRHPSRTYRAGTMSINVHEELDQGENCQRVLKAYFEEVVLPLANEATLPEAVRRLSSAPPPQAQAEAQAQAEEELRAAGRPRS